MRQDSSGLECRANLFNLKGNRVKNTVQVFSVEQLKGTGRTSGRAYDMRFAQCLVEREVDGVPAPLIGELILPEAYKDIAPGRYEVEFELSVSREKRIGAQVSKMTLISTRAAAPAASAPAPVKG